MAKLRGFYTPDKDGFAPKEVVEAAKDAMDKVLIKNWNDVIGKNDIVYHLGDFSFRGAGETLNVLAQLNGRKRLVQGNHDTGLNKEALDHFEWVKDYYEGKGPGGFNIVNCHFAFRVWNKSHRGSWNLCGHSHGNLPPRDAKQIDVGVDTNDLKPYSRAQIEVIMAKRGHDALDHHKKGSR